VDEKEKKFEAIPLIILPGAPRNLSVEFSPWAANKQRR
jgi:hypothetical protein